MHQQRLRHGVGYIIGLGESAQTKGEQQQQQRRIEVAHKYTHHIMVDISLRCADNNGLLSAVRKTG